MADEDDIKEATKAVITQLSHAYFSMCRRLASLLNRGKSGRR